MRNMKDRKWLKDQSPWVAKIETNIKWLTSGRGLSIVRRHTEKTDKDVNRLVDLMEGSQGIFFSNSFFFFFKWNEKESHHLRVWREKGWLTFLENRCAIVLSERRIIHWLGRELRWNFWAVLKNYLKKYGLQFTVSMSILGQGFCSAHPAAFRWDMADVELVSFQVNRTDSIGHGLEKLSCKGLDSKYFKLALWAIN